MMAVLVIQLCLSFGGMPLCQVIGNAPFRSVEDCMTAAALVTQHSGRGVTAMCQATGRAA